MWIVLMGVALARGPREVDIPVPLTPLRRTDQDRFDYCTTIVGSARGRQTSVIETDDGTIGLRCEQDDDNVKICLVLDPERWPSSWPEQLTCDVGRRSYSVHPYPAFDPSWQLGQVMELQTSAMGAMALVWDLPDEAWVSASVRESKASVRCSLNEEGQLKVVLKPPIRAATRTCVLSRADGSNAEVSVNVKLAGS